MSNAVHIKLFEYTITLNTFTIIFFKGELDKVGKCS